MAAALARALKSKPGRPDLLVQYGHALKEAGQRKEATAAYRRAATAMPDDLDVKVHLAALLRGDNELHEAAGLYGEVLAIDPLHAEAAQALADLGARELVPTSALSATIQQARLLHRDALRAALDATEEALVSNVFPRSRYDRYRRTWPLDPPPWQEAAPVGLVLARAGSAAVLRATLEALTRQTLAMPRIVVAASESLALHPVASIAEREPRFEFVSPDSVIGALSGAGQVLVVGEGALLDPQGVAWLAFTAARTGADAVYGDHDRAEDDWQRGRLFDDPVMFWGHDPDLIAAAPQAPIAALTSLAALRRSGGEDIGGLPEDIIRTVILAANAAVHVPRRIASRYRPPAPARAAPLDGPATVMKTARSPAPAIAVKPAHIAVVIPTRDQGVLLEAFVASLRKLAANPERIAFVILDNRSQEIATKAALARLRKDGSNILAFDEPFNWSRANNKGAAATDAPLLVFANNDMTMLSAGWDVALDRELVRPEVGAVGARLLYGDGTYQHAGVVFGLHEALLSTHEGIGHRGEDKGPGGRWYVRHTASAVTGAFLGTRRNTFEALDGFEEELAVAYNDIDYCLRIREHGERVIYVPEITLTHYESKTRGRTVTQAQVAWDEGELARLSTRWGPALRHDPSYNPQWALRGQPFDGFREPDLDEVLRWIDQGKGGNPWRVQRIGD